MESKVQEATKFQETMCSVHPQVKLTSYCNHCGDFVCNSCKPRGHDGHDFMSATEKTNELKEEIRGYMKMISEKALGPVQGRIREANAIKSRLENNCEELLVAVDKREEALIKDIQKCSRRLKGEIEKHRSDHSPALAVRLAKLEESEKKIDDFLKSSVNVINTGNMYDILACVSSKPSLHDLNNTQFTLRSHPKLELHKHRTDFFAGEFFGYLRQSRVVSLDGIRVTQSRKYDSYIENIFVRNDHIWIYKTGTFVSMKPKTGQEMDIKLCSLCPSSFILTSSGEIIYSVSHEHSLYRINQTMPARVSHTYPYSPSGLCCALTGGFYVSMFKNGSCGKIVRYYNDECTDWLEIQCYRGGEPLLQRPSKIIENGNRDLLIIDDRSASVLAVNPAGKFKFEFKGSEKNFEPMGICTDCRHNVLISDYSNKVIDILLHNGQLLTTINLQKFSLSRPMGVCVTKDGELCVGQGNGWMHFLRYLQ